VGPRIAARPFQRPVFLLPILNYRAANCPCVAAPSYVGVECPAALFLQCLTKALDIWLAIYYEYNIGHKRRALLLLSLPYLISIIDIYVLRALHRVRAQLPARYLQHNSRGR
jgi:hypothetical protein